LLLLAGSLSSCVELVEEINIRSDQSGQYHLYLNYSGLSSFLTLIPTNFSAPILEEDVQKLEKQAGIHNLSSQIELQNARFSIQFDFDNIKQLNNAFYALFDTRKHFYQKSFIKANKHKIKRPNLSPYLLKYIEENRLQEQIPKNALNYVDYRLIIHTPKEIRSAKPKTTPTDSNPYTYTQVYPLKTLLTDNLSTKVSIRLK